VLEEIVMFTQQKYYGTRRYDLVCTKLKSIVNEHGEPIGYAVVFKIMGLRPGDHAAKEAGQLLGEISDQMHRQGKPMLSALVINQQEKMPGKGFFELAISLGKLRFGASDSEKKAFWKSELTEVYSTTW